MEIDKELSMIINFISELSEIIPANLTHMETLFFFLISFIIAVVKKVLSVNTPQEMIKYIRRVLNLLHYVLS